MDKFDEVSGASSPLYDPVRGEDRIIRTILVQTDPTKELDKNEVLDFHRDNILKTLSRDGWELIRELEIDKQKNGIYAIFAVCKPMQKHGVIIGSTNQKPKGLHDYNK